MNRWITSAGHTLRYRRVASFASWNVFLLALQHWYLHQPQYWRKSKLRVFQWWITHHLNRIEFTMELQQEYAFMASVFNQSLKHRWLVFEVILLAEESCHTAIFALNWTDWQAFGSKLVEIRKSSFLEDMFHSLGVTIRQCHCLWLAAELSIWVCHGNDGIFFLSLFPTIRFIHFKCLANSILIVGSKM